MGYVWKPIEPLTREWESWADPEIDAVRIACRDIQGSCDGTVQPSYGQVPMEWSIETGLIENLYRWDDSVTQNLLLGGLRTEQIPEGASLWPRETVAEILNDQAAVLHWLLKLQDDERPWGTSLVHEIHAGLLRNQPRLFPTGSWKTLPNSVQLADGTIHNYCPPEQAASEIDRLLEWLAAYRAAGVSPVVTAAWLHHRFVQIHPYPDGNGRTARALSSLVLLQGGLPPLLVFAKHKGEYFHALERADRGSLADLVGFFQKCLRTFASRYGSDSRQMEATTEAFIKHAQDQLEEMAGAMDGLDPRAYLSLFSTGGTRRWHLHLQDCHEKVVFFCSLDGPLDRAATICTVDGGGQFLIAASEDHDALVRRLRPWLAAEFRLAIDRLIP